MEAASSELRERRYDLEAYDRYQAEWRPFGLPVGKYDDLSQAKEDADLLASEAGGLMDARVIDVWAGGRVVYTVKSQKH